MMTYINLNILHCCCIYVTMMMMGQLKLGKALHLEGALSLL